MTSAISLSGNTKQFNVFDKEGIALDVNNKRIDVLTNAISLSGNTKQFNVFGTEGIALDINNKNLSFLNGVISFSSDPNVNNFKAVDNGNVGKSCVGIVNNGNTTLDASVSITTTNSTVSSNSFSVNSKSSISKHDSISLLGDSNTLANSSINILGKNNILNTNSILFNSNNSTVSSGSVQINGDNNFVDNNSLSILGNSNFVTNSSTNIASNNNKIYNNSLNINGFNNLVSSNSVALNSFDSNLRDISLAINTFNSGLSTNSILINSRNTKSELSSVDLLGSNNTLSDKSFSVNGQNNAILSNSLAFNTNNSSITGNSVVLGGNSNIVNDFSFVVASSGSKAYKESSVIGGKGNIASLSSVAIGSVNTEIIGQNSQSIGGSNNDFNSSNSVFLGGQNNASADVPNGTGNGDSSFIIGGTNNKTGTNGIIIGGKDNLIQNNSIVIGGSGNNTGNFSNVLILGRNDVVVDRNNVVYLPEIRAQGNLTITGNITAGGNITNVNTTTGNISSFNVNNYLYDIVTLQVDQNKTPLVGTLDSARFNYFGQPRLYVNNQGVSINTSSSVLNQALTISGNVSASGNLKVDNTLLIGADANLYRSATNTLKTDDNFVVGNITVPISLAAATTDAVVINNSNTLAQRSIDSRVWGTTLVDGNGNGTINYIPKWTDSNTVTNSQVFDNGTNVGIGTTAPNEKLTVSGNISASLGFTGQYVELVYDRGNGDGGYIDFRNSVSDDFDCRIIQTGKGLQLCTGSSGSSLGRMTILSGGNIGINTSTPNERLTVSGNISATGNLTVNGDVVLGSDALDTLTFNGGPVNFPNATSTGDAIILGEDVNLYRSSADILRTSDTFVADGSIFTNSSYVVITNSNFPQYVLRSDGFNNNRWGMWVQTPSTPTTGNPLSIGPQDAVGSGNPLLTLTRTSSSTNAVGNVGINTNTPNERLTVFGNISASGNIYSTGAYRAVQGVPSSADSSTNGYAFGADGDTGLFSPIIGAGGAANAALALYCNNTVALSTTHANTYFNTNVGIGTTVNPAEKLTVNGNIGALGDVRISSAVSGGEGKSLTIINNVDNILNTSVALYLQPNNASGNARAAAIKAFQSPTAGNNTDLRFYTSNFDLPAERMIITSDGNVGIGTTSLPSAKLDVQGTVAANYLRVDPQDGVSEGGEIQLVGAGSFANVQIDNASGNFRVHTLGANNYFQIVGGGSTTALRVENGGAYIGSIATGSTNSVITESSGTLQKRTIDSRVWGTSLADGSGTENYVAKWTTGGKTITNSRIFDNGTNVGIGNTNPQHALHVNGTIFGNHKGVLFGDVGTVWSSAFQVREAGLNGNVNMADSYRPRLAFHWSGAVASSISLRQDGAFSFDDNPGTGRSNIFTGIVDITGPSLPTTLGSSIDLLRTINFNGNSNYLRIFQYRHTDGTNWESSSTKIMNTTDASGQAYIEFNPKGNTRGMAFGTGGTTERMRINSDGNIFISENISGVKNVVMGTQANKATLTYTTNTARTYTIPDAGANAEFVMNAGNQTIAGNKTFSGNTTFPSGAAATPSINFTGSVNTGFYFATNQVSTSIAGTEKFRVTNNFVYTPKLLVNTTSTSTEVFKVEGDSRLKNTYINSNGQEFLISSNYGVNSVGRNIYIGNGGQFTAGTSSNFGSHNTSLGVDSLSSITTGRFNTAIGSYAQEETTSGEYNTSLGSLALRNNLTGGQNTAIGHNSLNVYTGSFNTAVGMDAMSKLTFAEGTYNTCIGHGAMKSVVFSLNNTAIGAGAMGTTTSNDGQCYENVAVGYLSLSKCGQMGNTAVGSYTGKSLAFGRYNCFFGASAGQYVTNGSDNVLMGDVAGDGITTGNNNVSIGTYTLYYNNVSNCVAIGYQALHRNYGGNNVAIGYQAGRSDEYNDYGYNPSGLTFVGYQAGFSNYQGANNTAIGHLAGYNTATGANNTSLGKSALNSNVGGQNNTAIGLNALYEALGSDNIGIGANAGRLTGSGGAALTTGTNNILIGSYSRPSTATGTNQIVIGNSLAGRGDNTFTLGTGTTYIHTTFTGGNGTPTWTRVSDISLKKNINKNNLGLNFIKKINPVTYNWIENNKLDKSNPHYREENEKDSTSLVLGLIAQNVKQAMDEDGADYFSGWSKESSGLQGISLEPFVLPLINAVKELSERLEKLESKIK